MYDNTISLCMIVKDEAKNIQNCLANIYMVMDEIIVVDTGSIDNTVDLAKLYGAKVICYKWNDDFSEARNISLKYATKNWILILDADEVIEYDEVLRLKNILRENSHLEGFHLRLSNIISNKSVGDAIVLRVFKNNKNYIFEGNIHEQIIKSIERVNGKVLIGSTDINIKHYGYDPQITDINKKQKRNLELLNSYPQEKRDGYYYYSLGNEYARINNNYEALKHYYKALQAYLPKEERPVYLSYLYINILKVLNSCKKYKEEIEIINKFKKVCENFKDLYFMECIAYIECNKMSKARFALEKYLECNTMNYEYPNSDFEKHYDIDELLEKLKLLSIQMDHTSISVLILCKEENFFVENTIKSVNEISDDIIVVKYENLNINTDNLENLLASVIDVKEYISEEEMFIIGAKKCKCKFILLLMPNDILSIENQKLLLEEIQNSNVQNFSLKILDASNIFIRNELRLYENSIPDVYCESLYEYSNYIDSRLTKNLDIAINKM